MGQAGEFLVAGLDAPRRGSLGVGDAASASRPREDREAGRRGTAAGAASPGGAPGASAAACKRLDARPSMSPRLPRTDVRPRQGRRTRRPASATTRARRGRWLRPRRSARIRPAARSSGPGGAVRPGQARRREVERLARRGRWRCWARRRAPRLPARSSHATASRSPGRAPSANCWAIWVTGAPWAASAWPAARCRSRRTAAAMSA